MLIWIQKKNLFLFFHFLYNNIFNEEKIVITVLKTFL